ncbi:MAG: hypothetical protein Q7S05_04735 [bacterium]|nr:hypothetical protein [bacterium]
MNTKLALLALLLGAMLVPVSASADSGKKDCDKVKDPLCDAYKHPQTRVLKPTPCLPISFDQWQPDTVVMRIKYKGGKEYIDSKLAGIVGQFCRGEWRFRNAEYIELCRGLDDNGKSFKLYRKDIDAGLAGLHRPDGKRGWSVTLKGVDWYEAHKRK